MEPISLITNTIEMKMSFNYTHKMSDMKAYQLIHSNLMIKIVPLLLMLLSWMQPLSAQDQVDIGIFSSTTNQIDVKIRPNFTINSDQVISNIKYSIRWSDPSIVITNITYISPYFLAPQGGPVLSGGYYYQLFDCVPGAPVGSTISPGQEVLVSSFTYSAGSSCSFFEIIDSDAWTSANNADFYVELGGADVTGIVYDAFAPDFPVSCPTVSPVCCNDAPFALSGGIPAGGTYSGTHVTFDGTDYIFTPLCTSTGDFEITYTRADGCNSCTFTVTVLVAPTVSAGTYGPACIYDPDIPLAGNPSGGVWTGTGVSGNQNDGYSFDPSVGTQALTYTYTDGNGCSEDDVTTVTVNDAVEVQISVDGTTPLPPMPGTGQTSNCANEDFEMTLLSIVQGTGPMTFVYNVYEGPDNTGTLITGSPFTVADVDEGGTIYFAAAGTLAAGTYFIETVSITDANGCQVQPVVMAAGYYNLTLIVNEEPQVSFGFNGVEAGWNASFDYCYDVPIGVTLYAEYGGTPPYSITYIINSDPPVTVTGLSAGSTIIAPQIYAPGIYNIAVTNITDSEGCQAGATFLGYCTAVITVYPEPIVNDVTLLADFGYSPTNWTWPVYGSYPNFSMCIDPLLLYPQYYFLDINTLTSTVALQSGELNGFTLDQASLPPDWLDYWAIKGVDGSSTDPLDWTYWMWPIINGSSPIFYIYLDGGDYQMIDGLTYQWNGNIEPLKVNGDYPAWNYKYTGKVLDVNGCLSSSFDVFLNFNSIQLLDADFTADDLTPPTNTTVTFTNQSTGTDLTYSWDISPATYIYASGTNSTSMNPKIRFLNGGLYSVTLTITDACGTDTEVKTDYIRAGTPGVWIGITSIEWNTSSNWDDRLTPDRLTDVLITTENGPDFWPKFIGDLLVGDDPSAHCKSITFEGTGYMRLEVTGTMTTLSNEGISTVNVISGEAEIKFENP